MASAIFHELLGFHSLKSEKITERGRISRRPMIYLSRLAQSARSLTRSHWFSLGKLIGGKELATSFTKKKNLRAVKNSLLVFQKTKPREYGGKKLLNQERIPVQQQT